MDLKSLVVNDAKWREIAFRLCGNRYDADDLVQSFYLKMYDVEIKKDVKNSYYVKIITNLFIDEIRLKQGFYEYDISNYINKIADNIFNDGIDDKEQEYISNFENRLSTEEKGLLIDNYEKSGRDLASINDISSMTMCRKLKEIRVKCLREDFSKKYKNKRLKN